MQENRTSLRRGFAVMSPEKQREIARQGGKAAHKRGVAHEWSSEEARQAGKKGGKISRRTRKPNGQVHAASMGNERVIAPVDK